MVLLINALAYRPLSAFKTVNQWHFINRVSQKTGPKTHDHNSVKSLPIYYFFTGRFLGKFAVKCVLKIPPHLAYVATLPCETLMPEKQAINDKYKIV